MEEGADPMTAAKEGTSEIAVSAVAAPFSIAAVFIPVAFMGGIIGRFFYQFGITVAASVIASLVIALILIPMLCSRYLKIESKHGKVYRFFDQSYEKLENQYRGALAFCLNHRGLIVLIAIVTFAGSIGILALLKSEFVPKSDQSRFVIRIETPTGSTLHYTDVKMKSVENLVLSLPETRSIFTTIGVGAQKEVNKGLLLVSLKERNERERSQQKIMDDLREKIREIPGFKAYVEEFQDIAVGGRRSAPLQLDIKGPDMRDLEKLSNQMMREMVKSPGIVDVSSDLELTKPEVRVLIDRNKASDVGVDIQEISSAILQMIGGQQVSKFKATERAKRYDVRIRLIKAQG